MKNPANDIIEIYHPPKKPKKGTSLGELFPEVAKEWCYERNEGLTPFDVTAKNNREYWWICDKGHITHARISSRTLKGARCSVCANQRVLTGYNDLESQYSEIAKTWHPTENDEEPCDVLMHESRRLRKWLCDKGHTYEKSVMNRVRGEGCQYCSGKKVLIGYNDLPTTHKEIMLDWDWDKNVGIDPTTLSYGSHKEVYWKCHICGYTQHKSPHYICNHRCPVCSGSKVKRGFNDLSTKQPWMLEFWDYENNDKLPTEIFSATKKYRVHWKCKECGYIWILTPFEMLSHKGCPKCIGHTLIKGYNDLETKFPEIAKEWDYSKNTKKPSEYSAFSDERVYWICPICGKSYQKRIASRTYSGYRCTNCFKQNNQTSFDEQALLYYLQQIDDSIIGDYKIDKYRFDIYIPFKNILIEYDGFKWHETKTERDSKKTKIAIENGYRLIRVKTLRDKIDGVKRDGDVIYYHSSSKNSDTPKMQEIVDMIGMELYNKTVNVDLKRDEQIIKNRYLL